MSQQPLFDIGEPAYAELPEWLRERQVTDRGRQVYGSYGAELLRCPVHGQPRREDNGRVTRDVYRCGCALVFTKPYDGGAV